MKSRNALLPVALAFLVLVTSNIYLCGETGPGMNTFHRELLQQSNTPMAEFHVSPVGNDTANGTEEYPFFTIQRAQEAVRELTSNMTGDIHVVLHGGRHQLSEGLVFGIEDGTNGTHHVVYKAREGEVPVIDGGISLSPAGWENHEDNVWKYNLSSLPWIGDFRQLYVVTGSGAHHNTPDPANDNSGIPYAGKPQPVSVMTPAYDGSMNWSRRAIRARGIVPEGTFTLVGDGHEYLHSSGIWADLREWETARGGIMGDWDPNGPRDQYGMSDVEFVYHLLWNLPRVKVHHAGIVDGRNRVVMQQPAFHLARTKGGTPLRSAAWPGTTEPSWVENAYQLLDEPGEWFHDRHGRMLFYWPLPQEPAPNTPGQVKFIVPRVEQLVHIEGNATHPVQNLRFEGITFKHSSWLRPNSPSLGHVDVQANVLAFQDGDVFTWEPSPGTVRTVYAHGIIFERCTFSKLGGAGIDLHVGTSHSSIRGCLFDDLSGTAVNIGHNDPNVPVGDPRLPVNNSVVNNYFGNIAVEFKGGHAIWAGYVRDTVIEHNRIQGTAYTAISVGWGWSPAQTGCRNNSISHNHISNYMMEMKDGGAIYTLSLQNDTRVIANHIHDGCGSGLYPDEQTWNTTWKHNVVYRSGNSLQDHTRGEEPVNDTSIRENDISDNYFDMLPIIQPKRQAVHLPNNYWDISSDPNASVLAIVDGAGIQEPYQDIIPTGRLTRRKDQPGLYWSDILEGAIDKELALAIAVITGMITIGVIGSATVVKPQWFRKKKTNRGNHDE